MLVIGDKAAEQRFI